MNDLTGTTIDRYKIVRELGRGGMAVVYRAVDGMLDRNVAVKMILSESDNREKAEKLLKRFHREAKTLASLSHPNIVKVLDYGEYEANPYLVMEFVSGGSLKARMNRPLPYAEAAALLVPVARALQHAHQQKIVHRDVKPENILINESDQPMLSDFGILKLVDTEESHGLTGTGKIVGTPAYMSPEQIRGREVDGRTDMYSLGILFFEMVTGRKPYSANTPIELSMQHLHDPIPKAKQFVRDLPAEVDQVIARAIAKNPEDRFPNMGTFAQALEKLSGATLGTTTAERRAMKAAEEKELAKKRTKRSNTPILIGGSVIGLLALAAFLFRGTLFPVTSAATEQTPQTAALATASPTEPQLPTEPVATATPRPPTSTPTQFSFDTSTPVVTPVVLLAPQNISRLTDVNRIDRISVINMDWIPGTNGLIDAGSNTISFIDAQTTNVIRVDLPGIPLSMAASPVNNRLYVLFNNNIQVVDTSTYKVVETFAPIAGGATSLAASPDGNLLALGISDNRTQLLNAEDGSVVRNLRSNYGGWSVAFSPNSEYVVSGTSQGILRWVTTSGLWQPTSGAQDKTIKSLAFSHDGTIIAGGSDGIIYFWDTESGELLNEVTGTFGMVNTLDFSPDDAMLVSGTDDSIVRIWNADSGTLLKQLTGHESRIVGVCFSPDGLYIASGAQQDGSIRIWGLP